VDLTKFYCVICQIAIQFTMRVPSSINNLSLVCSRPLHAEWNAWMMMTRQAVTKKTKRTRRKLKSCEWRSSIGVNMKTRMRAITAKNGNNKNVSANVPDTLVKDFTTFFTVDFKTGGMMSAAATIVVISRSNASKSGEM